MKKGVINMEKKNNWLNILKKLLIATGIVVIISVIATIGIGNYFVNYAILRTGNGGDREVKNKEVIEVASIDNETERVIEENREEEKQLANQWTNTIKNEKVEITANDGITLKGTEYIKDEQINDWVCSTWLSFKSRISNFNRKALFRKRLQCANSIYESHW